MSTRAVIALVCVLALTVCGCGSSKPKSGSTSTTQSGATPASRPAGETLVVSLRAPGSDPRPGEHWPITVIAHTATGAPVNGTVYYQFLFAGSVVARRPGGQMRNGIYHDRLLFPSRANGIPLVLRVNVTASGASGHVQRVVQVQR